MSRPPKRARISSSSLHESRPLRREDRAAPPHDSNDDSDAEHSLDDSGNQDVSSGEDEITDMSEMSGADNDGEFGESDEHEEEEEDDEEEVKQNLRHISFGALVDAQASVQGASGRRSPSPSSSSSRTRTKVKRPISADPVRRSVRPEQSESDPLDANPAVKSAEEKVARLRARLAELRGVKERSSAATASSLHATPGATAAEDEAEAAGRHKQSKHAPTEQSSSKPVSRRRQAVDTSHMHASYTTAPGGSSAQPRDPRFSSLSGPVNTAAHATNYAFLNENRAREIAALQGALSTLNAKEKKQRRRRRLLDSTAAHVTAGDVERQEHADEQERAKLRRTLDSLSNKQKAEEHDARVRKVKREHRAAEREAVRAGKKARPWFLKAAEVKRRVERERTSGMSQKQLQSSERRRLVRRDKKDRRRLREWDDAPADRRGVGGGGTSRRRRRSSYNNE